jgi:hypothetical protein
VKKFKGGGENLSLGWSPQFLIPEFFHTFRRVRGDLRITLSPPQRKN